MARGFANANTQHEQKLKKNFKWIPLEVVFRARINLSSANVSCCSHEEFTLLSKMATKHR